MGIWLWALIGIMAMIIVALLVKIYFLRKAAKEIETAFADRLITDTNTLIDISTSDKYMRSLANAINIQLRKLRVQRHRFKQGDTELKNAVTNISHDIRTPLTAICGYVELLRSEPLTPDAARYVRVIGERAAAMKQLTEELFRYSVTISSQKPLQIERVCVNDVLGESIASFYGELTAMNIEPQIELPDVRVMRELDRAAASRVFGNIIENAVRHGGGDLCVKMDELCRITFSNTAPDLDGVEVGRLFDRFFTVRAAKNSTGLGLSIARTLIERMGGEISARYEDGTLSVTVSL